MRFVVGLAMGFCAALFLAPASGQDTRLRFDQLTSGEHTVSLTLLAEDNRPLSPTIRLDVSIPARP